MGTRDVDCEDCDDDEHCTLFDWNVGCGLRLTLSQGADRITAAWTTAALPVTLAACAWAQEKRTCVVAARLDNLGKGASGAAVQNLNIAMGIDEKTGL